MQHTKHPVFESIDSPSNWPSAVGRFHVGQIAQRGNWRNVPDVPGADLAAIHTVDVLPNGTHTSTILNPLDPGTVDDVTSGELGGGWFAPHNDKPIIGARAGRRA
jgi:hypothetical protein